MDQEGNTHHALILSAGFSQRMGEFKPLLPLGDGTVLERLVDVYRQAGVGRITIVNGHRGDEVRAMADRLGVASAHNPHPEHGMFSSVQAGIAAIAGRVERTFIHPVDIPLVRPDTITLLLRAAAVSDAPVLIPCYDGKAGHPPLMTSEVFSRILASDGDGGLRAVLDSFERVTVPVADREILFDLDRMDDYHEARKRLADRTGLTVNEAELLLRLYFRVPPRLYAHSHLVAILTGRMIAALANQGVTLDGVLAEVGAWLHDIGKGRPSHAATGAEWLRKMGFPAVAAIVFSHNAANWPQDEPFDERAVVALADKMAEGDRLVTVARRFRDKMDLFVDDPEATAAAQERLQGADALASRFETLAKISLESLLQSVKQEIGGIARPSFPRDCERQ